VFLVTEGYQTVSRHLQTSTTHKKYNNNKVQEDQMSIGMTFSEQAGYNNKKNGGLIYTK